MDFLLHEVSESRHLLFEAIVSYVNETNRPIDATRVGLIWDYMEVVRQTINKTKN